MRVMNESMNSILNSTKKLLGISEEYTHFDDDIIIAINSAFMILAQLGIGPSNGFRIEDNDSTWDEFMSDRQNLQAVKTYIHLKVKLIFDPPASSVITESINQMIRELEWRLNNEVETVQTDKEEY